MKNVILTRYSAVNSKKSKAATKEERDKEDDARLTHEMQFNDILKIIGDEKYIHIKESNTSGYAPLEKRPKLNEALELLKKGDTLAVWSLDRLFRGYMEGALIFREIEKRGATLLSATEDYIAKDDADSVMMKQIKMAFSEREGRRIRERIKSSMQTKKARGERVGYIPYGYCSYRRPLSCIDSRGRDYVEIITPNLAEQELLSVMADFYFSNRCTYRQVAECLNTEGFRNRAGCPWSASSVYRILKSRDRHAEFYIPKEQVALQG